MRIRIDTLVLAAALASAPLAVWAQAAAPAAPPKQMTVDEKKADDRKKADEKKAEAKKKAAEKKAEAAKKAADAKDAKKTEAKPMKKQPEAVKPTATKVQSRGPGSAPIVEKRTVTDKGKSPFTLTDKDGKPVATSPDAYDVSSATTPPKKR
jgi:colicin import membrane protein